MSRKRVTSLCVTDTQTGSRQFEMAAPVPIAEQQARSLLADDLRKAGVVNGEQLADLIVNKAKQFKVTGECTAVGMEVKVGVTQLHVCVVYFVNGAEVTCQFSSGMLNNVWAETF